MQRYGCSRPSLRQALRILEHEQLLESRRGAGCVVRAPSPAACATIFNYLLEMDGVASGDVSAAREIVSDAIRRREAARSRSAPNATLELIDRMLAHLTDA